MLQLVKFVLVLLWAELCWRVHQTMLWASGKLSAAGVYPPDNRVPPLPGLAVECESADASAALAWAFWWRADPPAYLLMYFGVRQVCWRVAETLEVSVDADECEWTVMSADGRLLESDRLDGGALNWANITRYALEEIEPGM